MAYDLQEQESLDELKAWWEKWGNSGSLRYYRGLFGFCGLQRYEVVGASSGPGSQCGLLFSSDGDYAASLSLLLLQKIVDALIEDAGSTVYGPMGALSASRYLRSEGRECEGPGACCIGWWRSPTDPEFQTVARVRLAGFLVG